MNSENAVQYKNPVAKRAAEKNLGSDTYFNGPAHGCGYIIERKYLKERIPNWRS